MSLYVDDVLTIIEKSGLGCFIKKNCVNSFMYADDLILLTISIRDLQCLVSICLKEFALIGININSAKLCCLRIGPCHNVEVVCIAVNDVEIQWCKELRYLGLFITSARKFNVNLQNARHKFFSSLNGIFGKVGLNTSPVLLCSLINSFCVPILMYGLESVIINTKTKNSLENAYSQAFMKIFKTFDKNIISICQFNMGYLPIELQLVLKQLKFLIGVKKSGNATCNFLATLHNDWKH